MTPSLRSLAALLAIGAGATAGIIGLRPAALRATPAAAVPGRPALGINLAALSYYGAEIPFVDVFRTSQPFLHQKAGVWSLDEPLELRPDGYPARLPPGHLAGTLLLREIGGAYPAGDYVCLWEGEGDVDLGLSARVTSRGNGRLVAHVEPSAAGIHLTITRTDPADPVHDIRLLLPGTETTYREQPFHAAFLERWRGFDAVRFMDWMRTNDSPVRSWDDRARVDAQTQAGPRGMAPELVVDTANALGADAWICIPHAADDDYVAHLGALVRERLDRRARVYVEYSNETWNDQFGQAAYCSRRGRELGLAGDDWTARLRYASRRAVEVLEIFRAAFGDSPRVVRVLASQNANPAVSRELLQWSDAWRHVDALAVAPYFGFAVKGPAAAAECAGLTVDDVLDRCEASIAATLSHAAEHRRIAESLGLRLVAYEGGQHLVGILGAENDEGLVARFAAANRDPRIGVLYDAYLDRWRELAGDLLCAFDSTSRFSKWGCWGHAEGYRPGDDRAPKYLALRRQLGR